MSGSRRSSRRRFHPTGRPRHHDIDTLRFWRDALSRPDAAGWCALHGAQGHPRPTLAGTVSYKGPPADGVLEIGYSVVPSWQRRGLATEACRVLIESAWERDAEVIVAHTQPPRDVNRRAPQARIHAVQSRRTGRPPFTLRAARKRDGCGPALRHKQDVPGADARIQPRGGVHRRGINTSALDEFQACRPTGSSRSLPLREAVAAP